MANAFKQFLHEMQSATGNSVLIESIEHLYDSIFEHLGARVDKNDYSKTIMPQDALTNTAVCVSGTGIVSPIGTADGCYTGCNPNTQVMPRPTRGDDEKKMTPDPNGFKRVGVKTNVNIKQLAENSPGARAAHSACEISHKNICGNVRTTIDGTKNGVYAGGDSGSSGGGATAAQ